jgi:hypothetical protein
VKLVLGGTFDRALGAICAIQRGPSAARDPFSPGAQPARAGASAATFSPARRRGGK